MPTQIIYIAVVILVVILIIAVRWPRLKLFFTRVFRGKYSLAYVSLYKKYYFKSPYTHCIKDEFVFRIFSFFEKSKDTKQFKTNKTIQFGETPFLIRYNDFIKTFGKPYCFNIYLIQPSTNKLKIIGHKEQMLNTDMKALYYFIDNKFFMGEYVFKEITHETINKISNLLQKKYLDDILTEGTDDFYIENKDNIIIYFSYTGFALILRYYCWKDTQINNILEEYFTETRTLSGDIKNEHPDELYDKL
ncbi:MAG: hypothetical protein KAT33_04170 [Bacteroidales bacterium]|nr:hypothetical protein [Bacteroidales bacterium]